MNHLSDKDIAAFLLGSVDKKTKERIQAHLESCTECRKTVAALTPAIIPSFNIALPGDSLKQRILSSADAYRCENIPRSENRLLFFSHRAVFRPLMAGLTACAAVALVFMAYFMSVQVPDDYLQVTRIYGKADIDAVPARTHDIVNAGNTISTDDDSSMILRLVHESRLMLMGKSCLTVEKAGRISNRGAVKYTLNKGVLLSRHNKFNIPVKYEFDTPHAVINAEDADIILKAYPKRSSILLLKGKLVVQNKQTSRKIEVTSPGKYIVKNGIVKTDPDFPVNNTLQKVDEAFSAHDDDSDDILAVCDSCSASPAQYELVNTSNKMLMDDVNSIISGDEDDDQPDSGI